MPPIALEIIANVVFYLAGSFGGQALKQAIEEDRVLVGVGLALAFLAVASAGAWFIDPTKTSLDFLIWAVLYGIGIFSGRRRKG